MMKIVLTVILHGVPKFVMHIFTTRFSAYA